MNILFKTKDERKRSKRDRKMHKAMRSSVEFHERYTTFTVIACKLEFVDQFWLPYLEQPQSGVVVFQ